MAEIEKITPEYIVEQSKILTESELLELIEVYGFQQSEDGAASVSTSVF